jgi:hypothetical protein
MDEGPGGSVWGRLIGRHLASEAKRKLVDAAWGDLPRKYGSVKPRIPMRGFTRFWSSARLLLNLIEMSKDIKGSKFDQPVNDVEASTPRLASPR